MRNNKHKKNELPLSKSIDLVLCGKYFKLNLGRNVLINTINYYLLMIENKNCYNNDGKTRYLWHLTPQPLKHRSLNR